MSFEQPLDLDHTWSKLMGPSFCNERAPSIIVGLLARVLSNRVVPVVSLGWGLRWQTRTVFDLALQLQNTLKFIAAARCIRYRAFLLFFSFLKRDSISSLVSYKQGRFADLFNANCYRFFIHFWNYNMFFWNK